MRFSPAKRPANEYSLLQLLHTGVGQFLGKEVVAIPELLFPFHVVIPFKASKRTSQLYALPRTNSEYFIAPVRNVYIQNVALKHVLPRPDAVLLRGTWLWQSEDSSLCVVPPAPLRG